MPSRYAVLLTLSGDSNCPLWSYLHTGTLPRLISFVSHSYKNTGRVGVFFPFWNSLVGCRGFDPGNERLSKSSADYCRLITDHCPLTCPDPVGATATLALSPLDATLMDLPASVANKGLTSWLNPLDATLTKNRGGTSVPLDVPIFRRSNVQSASRMGLRDARTTCFRVTSLPRPGVTAIPGAAVLSFGRNLERTTYD